MSLPWVRVTATFVGFFGVGYALLKVVTPTPDQLYEKMSPEMRRKVDATRAQRLAAESAVRQQMQAQNQTTDPDEQKPVWAEQRR